MLWFIKRAVVDAYKAGYDNGISKGYKLGYHMGKVEALNKELIFGGLNTSQVLEEADNILKEKSDN